MPRGGARPGAGRKPTAVKYATAIARAEKRIADHLPRLIDHMMDLAQGVTVQEIDKEGDERVYSRAPDRDAIKYLMDRIMGRPTEKKEVELAGPGGGPIPIREVIVELHADGEDDAEPVDG